MSNATTARISVPVAKPAKYIPALQSVPLPDVHVGLEFPSLGWWWNVESINRDGSGLMVVRPVRPTNKMIKLTNEQAGR